MNLAVQHFNSCVYELSRNEKGETTPLMKQQNNAIPVLGIIIERRSEETFNQFKQEMFEKFHASKEPLKVFHMFPLKEEDFDTVNNFTVAFGWMVETRKHDPKQPIAVPAGDLEAQHQARIAALTPYQVVVPFAIAFVESDRFMFDLSVSHIPMGAITDYSSESVPATDMEDQLPIGLDPSQPFMSPDDMAKTGVVRFHLEQQIHEAASANNGVLPETFSVNDEKLAKDAGFESVEELHNFTQRTMPVLNMFQEACEQEKQ